MNSTSAEQGASFAGGKRKEYANFLIAAGLILLLAFIGYSRLLSKSEIIYSRYSDLPGVHLGVKAQLARSLKAGRGIPLWQENILSGSPAFANPQALYLYPFHFLFYVADAPLSFNLTFLLHFVVAGISMYVLAAVLGLNFPARIFSAVAYMFSFKLIMAAYAGWLPVLPALSFMPLLFASVLYGEKKMNIKGFLFVVLSLSVCILGGHLQLLYYSVLVLLSHLVYSCVRDYRNNRKKMIKKKLLFFAGAGVLSIGVCAVFLLPFLEYFPLMSRSRMNYYFFLSMRILKVHHLETLLYPEILGTPLDGSFKGIELWEYVFYFGIIPLILLIPGVATLRRRRHTAFFLAAFICCIVLSFNTPLTKLFFHILPGFGLFRIPARFLFLASFLGIVLGAIGFDRLIQTIRKRTGKNNAGPAAVILSALLIACVFAEGAYYSRRYIFTRPYKEVLPDTAYREFFARDASLYRIAPVGSAIAPGWAASFGLQLISGYDPVNLAHYQDYFDILTTGKLGGRGPRVEANFLGSARLDFLDALNVKYIASFAPIKIDSGAFRLAAKFKNVPVYVTYKGLEESDFYIYENKGFRERAFFVEQAMNADSKKLALELLYRIDIRREAVIFPPSRHAYGEIKSSPDDLVEIKEFYPGRLSIETKTAGERFLVVSEVWHPGWRARIDGKEHALHRADLALMGIFVPGGKHTVVLDFAPESFRVGFIVSISALTILLVIILLGAFRKESHGDDRRL